VLTTGASVLGDRGEACADEARPALTGWRANLEHSVLSAQDACGTVVRPGLVYGRGGSAVVRALLRVADETRAGWCVGEGLNRWSTAHIDDLPALYAAILETKARGIFARAPSLAEELTCGSYAALPAASGA